MYLKLSKSLEIWYVHMVYFQPIEQRNSSHWSTTRFVRIKDYHIYRGGWGEDPISGGVGGCEVKMKASILCIGPLSFCLIQDQIHSTIWRWAHTEIHSGVLVLVHAGWWSLVLVCVARCRLGCHFPPLIIQWWWGASPDLLDLGFPPRCAKLIHQT